MSFRWGRSRREADASRAERRDRFDDALVLEDATVSEAVGPQRLGMGHRRGIALGEREGDLLVRFVMDYERGRAEAGGCGKRVDLSERNTRPPLERRSDSGEESLVEREETAHLLH